MSKISLGRINAERRQCCRRDLATDAILAGHHAFDREERQVWKGLDRRRGIRRGEDVRLRVAQVG